MMFSIIGFAVAIEMPDGKLAKWSVKSFTTFTQIACVPNSQLPRVTKGGLGMLRFDCTHLRFSVLKFKTISKLRQSRIFPLQFNCESEETTNTTKHLSLQTFAEGGGEGGGVGGGAGFYGLVGPVVGDAAAQDNGSWVLANRLKRSRRHLAHELHIFASTFDRFGQRDNRHVDEAGGGVGNVQTMATLLIYSVSLACANTLG